MNHIVPAHIFMCFLVLAIKKKTYVCGTGGGPPTQDYTPAEDLALALNKGRPVVEGIQGGTYTDSVPPQESAPFIAGWSSFVQKPTTHITQSIIHGVSMWTV